MSECIICGAELDGADICALHEEDVLFTFTGDRSDQLIEGRYYEGTVDGFADFGVFVDLGNGVTGLLHRNELDRRLESLEWDTGDTVCVQVTGVRDDGNVDLGPSIRQSAAEFRGSLTQGPDDGPAPDPPAADHGLTIVGDDRQAGDLDRSQVRSLDRYLGRSVSLEGLVEDIRQTGGPTVFTLVDESGDVECAAFAGAGVRAYPEVDEGDAVRVRGKVEHRYGDHQVEVAALDRLGDEAAAAVAQRVADAAALPDSIDELPLLYADAANLAIETDIREGAAAIRRAIERGAPIRIDHSVTVDGYVAAAAIERAIEAVLADGLDPSRVRDRVRRRPIREVEYDLPSALADLGTPDERPFVILVDHGSTHGATAAFDLLELYEIDYYVIDSANPDPALLERVSPLVNPWCGEGTYPIPSTTSVAVNVAGLVEERVRDDLAHLPAVAATDGPPESAQLLLEESGYDPDDIEPMREAVVLEAYYQPWGDKRALIRRILFEREAGSIEPISEQFRAKLDRALEVAGHNASVRPVDGTELVLLDADRFGQRFEFPPLRVLLEGLLEEGAPGVTAAAGVARDHVELTGDVGDLPAIARELEARVPDAGVTVQGGVDGRIRFLEGRRDAVIEHLPDAVTAALG